MELGSKVKMTSLFWEVLYGVRWIIALAECVVLSDMQRWYCCDVGGLEGALAAGTLGLPWPDLRHHLPAASPHLPPGRHFRLPR